MLAGHVAVGEVREHATWVKVRVRVRVRVRREGQRLNEDQG